MFVTAFPLQIGSNQSNIPRNLEQLKQGQPSFWNPAQVSWEDNQLGGCVLGCATAFTQQAIGITLNLSFNNDKANITWQPDPTARFASSQQPVTKTTFGLMPGGLFPMPEAMGVHIDSNALKNLTPAQLQALGKAIGNLPVPELRQALSQAVSEEQKRRSNAQKKNCQAGQSGCPTSN